jgi:type 1 fimbria pilin
MKNPAMTFDGMLDIRGSLHHAPCILEMSSAYQTVDLGNVPRSYLQRPGDMAPPVAFQLRFMECRPHCRGLPDARTSTLVWSPYEPVLSVAFVAPADPDNPTLVQVTASRAWGYA